ncbi:uncharacterized protein LOC115542509 [Gadus morhua]|uniref:uncharacterized protein LOC115542509 n=1 Tax=Gadus morhua TaxID=8049 RepID=UPI0011B5593E|nr:uncharacterized protein LOC115542509 [Gadus morhua]
MRNPKIALQNSENPPTSTFIHLKIPLLEVHNHTIGAGSCFSRPIHPKLKNQIQVMVGQGITNIAFVKRALKQYVLNDLCGEEILDGGGERMPDGGGGERMLDGGGERMLDGGGGERILDGGGERMLDGGGGGGERILDGGGERMLDGGCRGEIMVDRLRIKSAQVAMREKLKKLTDDSYLCDDLETLQKMTVALDNMTQTIEQLCKRENGLILNKLDDIVMLKKHDLRALPVRKHKSKLSRKRKWTQAPLSPLIEHCEETLGHSSSAVLHPKS